jgi:serine/threonine-protein kinase
MKVFKAPGMTMAEVNAQLAEAITLSRMAHPNIIRVFDANTVKSSRGECAYFTMDYVAGGTLHDFWRSHGMRFVPLGTTVELLRQICRGLAVAHGHQPPIVHRDIKPENILVGYDLGGMRARISDFGLAKQVNPMTMLASGRGTLRFKAPEVFQEPNADSCAGDVWALGCVLYLLLTDHLPYEDVPDYEFSTGKFTNRRLVPPGELNAQVNPALDAITLRALAPTARQRYANAMQFLEALEAWSASDGEERPAMPAAARGETEKQALGQATSTNEIEARRLASQALSLARISGRLNEAADLMEEAVRKSMTLREEYEYQIELWRKGVVM